MHVNVAPVLALFTTMHILDTAFSAVCNMARARCMSRTGCGVALKTFMLNCNGVMETENAPCHEKCKHAIVSLLSTDRRVGAMFVNCDCEGNAFCEYRKKRISTCAKDVFEAMKSVDDDVTVLNCTLAIWICKADTACYTALVHYYDYCKELYSPSAKPACSALCNNSIAVLYHQRRAKKLKGCQCEQGEEVEYKRCVTIRSVTDRLCFHRQPQFEFHHVSTVTVGSGAQSFVRITPMLVLLIHLLLLALDNVSPCNRHTSLLDGIYNLSPYIE